MAVQTVGAFEYGGDVIDLARALADALTKRDVSCSKVKKVARGAGFDAKPSRRSMLVMIIPGPGDSDDRSVWIGEGMLPLGNLLGASGEQYQLELRELLHLALTIDLGVEDVEWMVEEAWLAANPDR